MNNYSKKTAPYIVAIIFTIVLIFKYESAIKKSFMAEFHFAKGYNYSQKKDYENALREYKIALDIKPSKKYVHRNIGIILQKQGNYDEAAKQYEAELLNDPGNSEVRNVLVALFEYKRQMRIYEKLMYLLENSRVYNDSASILFDSMNKIQTGAIKEDDVRNLLFKIKDNLWAGEHKIKRFVAAGRDMEYIKFLFVKAFNKKINFIDYLLENNINVINYAVVEKQAISMLKNSDIYMISAYKNITVAIDRVPMISSIAMLKELNAAIAYYSNYLSGVILN